jgi:hypothetical protein
MLREIGNISLHAPQCWQLLEETSVKTSAFEEANRQWEQILKCLADHGSEACVGAVSL